MIDDSFADTKSVKKVLFCSGKIYFDLAERQQKENRKDIAIVRVEQLYPFPVPEIGKVIERYPNVEQIVWAQEEPKNQGAWEYMNYRLKKLVGMGTPVNYVGLRRSASPAEGSKTAWGINQGMITEYAFTWDFKADASKPRHK